MSEYLHLLVALLRATIASRADLIAENLLRQQLDVPGPTRSAADKGEIGEQGEARV